MSFAQMQQAMALLIRHPEENRGKELLPFLAEYQLEPAEIWQLRRMARDENVLKFGRTLRTIRWETLLSQVDPIRRFLPASLLERLFREFFEPASPKIRLETIARDFLEFLLSDPRAREYVLLNSPIFLQDILRFEFAKARLRARELPPVNSYEVITLNYDVLKLGEGQVPDLRPVVALLSMPNSEHSEIRTHEIRQETALYLARPIGPPSAVVYAELVAAGLRSPAVSSCPEI